LKSLNIFIFNYKTASHCYDALKTTQRNDLNAYLGPTHSRIRRGIDKVLFNEHEKANKIGLLKMDKRVNFNSFVQPIALPSGNENFSGVEGHLIGFAKQERTLVSTRAYADTVNLSGCLLHNPATSTMAAKKSFCVFGKNVSNCEGKKNYF
jgi:hypothetical protein